MSEPSLRRCTTVDAATVAGIQVRGWQWAFRGLLPDPVLDALSVERREPFWRRQLESQRHIWLAEREAPLGFVYYGPAADAALPAGTGEVFALYQEEHAARTGVGRALFAHAGSELHAGGCHSAVLWVLENNQRARRFYERAGWTADGAVRKGAGADQVPVVRYQTTFR